MAGFIFQSFQESEEKLLSPILDTEKEFRKHELNLVKNERKEERKREKEGRRILLSRMACPLGAPDPELLKALKQGVWVVEDGLGEAEQRQ